MMKCCLLAATCSFFLPMALRAQALPSATRGGIVQVGGGITSANPDYTQKRISGVTAYATFDFGRHIGVEGDIHYVSILTPFDFGENTYEVGPRYVLRFQHLEPYAKVLFGIGSGQFQQGVYDGNVHTSKYFEYGAGAGVDLRISHNLNIRLIDVELQKWPSFPPNSLTPSLITAGVAYRIR